MPILTTAGMFRWSIDMRGEPAFYSHLGGPSKDAVSSASRTVLGAAVAAAVLLGAQGAVAAESGQIQTKAAGTSQEEKALPAITVTGRMDTATTEGTGSYLSLIHI